MRNEVDVLESWLRYHAQILDHLIIADHLSVDGSLELAREARQEGLPLDVYVAEDPVYGQSRLVTHLAREAIRLGADWVFPLDADEFLNTAGDQPSDVLRDAPRLRPLSIPWCTYVPTREDPATEPSVPSRITWRLKEEPRPFSKVAIPAELLRPARASIATGSHRLIDSGTPVESVSAPEEWSIAHFPVRSPEQLARKALVGWVSMLATPNRRPDAAYQWQGWYETLLEADLSTLDATRLAITYLTGAQEPDLEVALVRDPLPLCHFSVQSRGHPVAPLKAFASAAESIATELAKTREMLPEPFMNPPALLDTR